MKERLRFDPPEKEELIHGRKQQRRYNRKTSDLRNIESDANLLNQDKGSDEIRQEPLGDRLKTDYKSEKSDRIRSNPSKRLMTSDYDSGKSEEVRSRPSENRIESDNKNPKSDKIRLQRAERLRSDADKSMLHEEKPFQVLNEQGYKRIATEDFENTAELCAAILIHGVNHQLKRGLGKEYIPRTEAISSIRGKIDISASIKEQTILRKQMVCSYDEFSIDSYMNRIIKSTMILLLGADISRARKKELRKILVFFGEVETVDLHLVNWNIQYNRNNQTYRMLISICYLVVKGLLQTQSDGTTKLMSFLDEQRMHRLYEKFILGYYRREYPEITANASQIPWQLDDDVSAMLPVMQTDIMLTYGEKTLIIDAKYYAHSTQISHL